MTSEQDAYASLVELQRIEQKLMVVRELIAVKVRSQRLGTCKPAIFSLFEKGIVAACDFENKDRFTRRIVAGKLVYDLINLGVRLSDLFYAESSDLQQIARNRSQFLNGDDMIEEGNAFMTWLEALWKEFHQSEKAPPGGPPVLEVIPIKQVTTKHRYYRLTIRHIEPSCDCCCGHQEKVIDIPCNFRSDLTAYEIRRIICFSRTVFLGTQNDTYTYIAGLYYNGNHLDVTRPIPNLRDNGIIEFTIGSRESRTPASRQTFDD